MIKDGNFPCRYSFNLLGTAASAIQPDAENLVLVSDSFNFDFEAIESANEIISFIKNNCNDIEISDAQRFNDSFLKPYSEDELVELIVETDSKIGFSLPSKFDVVGDHVEIYREINFIKGVIIMRIFTEFDIYMEHITSKPQEIVIVRN